MGRGAYSRRRSWLHTTGVQRYLTSLLTFGPLCALVATAVTIAWLCRSLLDEALRGEAEPTSRVPLILAVLAFFVISALVVGMHGLHVSNRVAGAATRVGQSLARIRQGDITFRLHLRRDDHLVEVADECNRLLDWLNQNPPSGVQTGGDVVEVDDGDPVDLGPERHFEVVE